MTRVCVTWDREETARLVARCREALEVSDETAKAVESVCPSPWLDGASPFLSAGHWLGDAFGQRVAIAAPVMLEHLAANDPSTRLALNRALTAVLDGITATLGDGYQSRYEDVEHAQASLAAIAAALGQEEADRG